MKRGATEKSKSLHLTSTWICTFDPTGDFTDAKFDLTQMRMTATMGHWAPGTTWRNAASPNRLAIYADNRINIQK